MPRARARRPSCHPGRAVALALAAVPIAVAGCTSGTGSAGSPASGTPATGAGGPTASSSSDLTVERPSASPTGTPEPATVPDACGLASPAEVSGATGGARLAVTARSVLVGGISEDLCGFGAPGAAGTYAFAVALRTGVGPLTFARERTRLDDRPRFSTAFVPADATPRPVSGLGRDAWSRTTYVIDSRRARATGVEVQARTGRVVLRVAQPLASGAEPDPRAAVRLARVLAPRVDQSFVVPARKSAAPCSAVPLRSVHRALGVAVRGTRAVVEEGGVQCWYDAGRAFLQVVSRRGAGARAVYAAAARGQVLRVDLGLPDVRVVYRTSPHRDATVLLAGQVLSITGLSAGEARGALPATTVTTPRPADRGLLRALVRAFAAPS